ncbi:MAG: vWA domain-containing protein [Brevinema sp.]
MLFIKIAQAPWVIGMICLLFLLIFVTLYRQKKIRSLLLSSIQQKALLAKNLPGAKITKLICMVIISIMLGISLLDPRGSSLSSELELEGIDLVLIYDISRSMDVQDIGSSRLDFSKKLGAQLADSLVGNRVGLVIFAAEAIRLIPLTTDINSIILVIDELSTDMLSSQSTDIGKALNEALKNFQEDTLTHKSIVLFTDGENLDGSVDNAIDEIKQQGISLFIVGTGTEEGGAVPIIDKRNRQTNILKNALGQGIVSKLDTSFLQNLATKSSGTYLYGSRAAINELSTLIDNITKSPFGTNTQSFLEPKFRVFILCALLALILYLFIPDTKKRMLPLLLILLNSTSYGITTERHAYSSYQDGEYSSALRFFQRSLIKNPKNSKSKFGEGSSLYKLERGDRAEKSFLALTNDEHPKISQQAIFNAANARIQKKELDGALELYKEVIKNNPENSRLYQKALNNYLYTRALQEQQQQNPENQQNSEQQDQESQQQEGQENSEQQNQAQEGQNEQPAQNQENQQQEEQDQQRPSQSVSPSDIDNLLSVAEKDEKENLSKQFKKTEGLFQKNKY